MVKSQQNRIELVTRPDGGGSPVIVLTENHFGVPQKSINYLKTPKGFARYASRITLKNLSVIWQVYGGSDFSNPQTSVRILRPTSPLKEHLPQSTGRDMRSYNDGLKTKGGPARDTSKLLEVFLHKVSFQHEVYPPSSPQSSRQVWPLTLFFSISFL